MLVFCRFARVITLLLLSLLLYRKYERANSDDPSVDDMEAVEWLRGGMKAFAQQLNHSFSESMDKCVHTEFKVRMCFFRNLWYLCL